MLRPGRQPPATRDLLEQDSVDRIVPRRADRAQRSSDGVAGGSRTSARSFSETGRAEVKSRASSAARIFSARVSGRSCSGEIPATDSVSCMSVKFYVPGSRLTPKVLTDNVERRTSYFALICTYLAPDQEQTERLFFAHGSRQRRRPGTRGRRPAHELEGGEEAVTASARYAICPRNSKRELTAQDLESVDQLDHLVRDGESEVPDLERRG